MKVEDYEVLSEIEEVPTSELKEFIKQRVNRIVRNTPEDSWDNPEKWTFFSRLEAAELAHAVYRLLRDEKMVTTHVD